MAHSPCIQRRAQREMEGEQDGKILSQPVNLYEVHQRNRWLKSAASTKKQKGKLRKGRGNKREK